MTYPPECECDPFEFFEGQFTVHAKSCPRYCDCPVLQGKRGRRRVHVETCGWYQPAPVFKSGPIQGMRPKYMIIDELE